MAANIIDQNTINLYASATCDFAEAQGWSRGQLIHELMGDLGLSYEDALKHADRCMPEIPAAERTDQFDWPF